jgi:hypothetical protein
MTVAGSVQEEIAGVLIEVCLVSAAEMKIFGSFLGVPLKIFARKTEMEKKYNVSIRECQRSAPNRSGVGLVFFRSTNFVLFWEKGSFWKKKSKENLTNFAKVLEKNSKFCKYYIYIILEKKTLIRTAFVSSDGLK